MWILIAIVLKLDNYNQSVPVFDKPLLYNTHQECHESLQEMYEEYKKLQSNYPVEIEFKLNDNNQKYMLYSYKPDYTKSKITTYYHCLKAYRKE